jgi:hypothetical protein
MAALALIFENRELWAQEEPLCVENSPERHGEIGCSIVETKLLPVELKELVFWHIDRFDNGELARAVVGPTSIAFEAELGGGCRSRLRVMTITEAHTSPK